MSIDNRANNVPPVLDDEVWELALHKLVITNGPGKLPSTVRVADGELFTLDGDEQNDFDRLRRQGHITRYTGAADQIVYIEAHQQSREIATAKPRIGRKRKNG